MKIKEENYKTIDLFSYCKKTGLSDLNSNYFIKNISNYDIKKQIRLIKRLKKEPIQYVLEKTNFYGYDYKVNKNVLIPRFETEELVENTIKYIKRHFNNKVKVLDLGTGTGCIGITIKKELPNIDITISDISSKALLVAKENSKQIDIKIVKGNLLDPFVNKKEKFNVIICNPPYIARTDKIDKMVKNNEPHLALYARENGLFYYKKILKIINKVLEDDFVIAFEIGSSQKDDIISIIEANLTNIKIEVKKDLQGRDRMIFIHNLTNNKKDV